MSRVYGPHAVEELLEASPGAIRCILVARQDPSHGALVARAEAQGVAVEHVDRETLRQRSGGRGAAGIGADLRLAHVPDLSELTAAEGEQALIIALDGVTDPHNLGAVIRTAAAFGAAAVIVAKDRSAPLNDAAVRASAGGVAHVPLMRVTNLSRALRQLTTQGYWVMGTAADAGTTVWDADLAGAIVLVLGAEGDGMRRGVASACDLTLHLPLPGAIGSLNVSVFAGIACAEVARQRRSALAEPASGGA